VERYERQSSIRTCRRIGDGLQAKGTMRVEHSVEIYGRAGRGPPLATTTPLRKSLERGRPPNCGSKVVVVLIGNARSMRNRDGQTAAHVGIRNSGITVETLGEVMIRIEHTSLRGAQRRNCGNRLWPSRSAECGSRFAVADTRRK